MIFISISLLLLSPCSALSLVQTRGMCMYGNSDQPVSNSVSHDPFLRCKVRETLNARPWWICGHSNPHCPRAVYADPCRFDREVSCGICGFCDGWNRELFHPSFSPSTMPLPLSLSLHSYEKSDHCWRLKSRLSFWACVCWCRLLIVCVFRPGVERLWGVMRGCMYLEGSPHSQRDEGLKHMLLKGSQEVLTSLL